MYTRCYAVGITAYAAHSSQSLIKNADWGFPGGAVVESLPASAGDAGLKPWSGRIPQAAEQLGP